MNNTTQNPAEQSSVVLKITVAIILVLILGGLVWLGSVSKQQAQRGNGAPQLSEEEKAAILANLKNTKAPELSATEKAAILKNLQNTKAPELSAEEKARILESLQNTR